MWWKETLYFLSGWLFAYVRRFARTQRVLSDKAWHNIRRFFVGTGSELYRGGFFFGLVAFTTFSIVIFARPAATMTWPFLRIFACAAIATIMHVGLRLYLRDLVEQQHTDNTRRFAGVCTPDSHPFNTAVVIRGNVWCDRTNFLNEFRAVPKDATSVVLVLRQTPSARHFFSTPYAFESMRRQLEARSKHPKLRDIKVEWVCFENKFHTVEAYMSYARFEADILGRKNTAYAALLSITDAKEFREFLVGHMTRDDEQKKTGTTKPDTICGLETRCGSHTQSKLDVLTRLLARRESDLMLTSIDRKRLGIVTLSGLVRVLLGGYIGDEAALKRLNQAIKNWDEASAKIVATLEAEAIAELPPVTGDDVPGCGAELPHGEPFSGPAAGRLTPPSA